MESVQAIKQRFGIIGNSPSLNRAIEKAIQVSPTDISVLVTGESGVGKESIPKIIHQLSHRKHNKYIAVNCGAIPEGTIDSELFGHEKGAFTGATQTRASQSGPFFCCQALQQGNRAEELVISYRPEECRKISDVFRALPTSLGALPPWR